MTLSDPGFVARQYGDAANLEARIALHRRFGAAQEPLPRRTFGQLAARLGRELDPHKAIRITTDPGLFVARR